MCGIDDALTVRHVVYLMNKDRAFFCQLVHDITVMDNFAANVNGRPKSFQGNFHDVDRTHNASAKASRLQ